MISHISGASVSQLERLIDELRRIRNFLLSEGQRIQREVTEHVRLNHRALESTRAITGTLQKWTQGPDPG